MSEPQKPADLVYRGLVEAGVFPRYPKDHAMDMEQRKKEYEAKVGEIYSQSTRIRRQAKDKKLVEEYLAMAEEIVALEYDADRAEHQLRFCDTDTQRGRDQLTEYTRMMEHGRARVKELTPKCQHLWEKLGISG